MSWIDEAEYLLREVIKTDGMTEQQYESKKNLLSTKLGTDVVARIAADMEAVEENGIDIRRQFVAIRVIVMALI